MFCNKLTADDIIELRKLHQEWFPIPYDSDFYDRIKRDNYIPIGAFYRLPDGSKVLIGSIFCHLKKESENNQVIFNRVDEEDPEPEPTLWQSIKNMFSCREP